MSKSLRTKVLAYAKKQYDTQPDKPWAKYPDNEVMRHNDTKKWYGLIIPVEREKLGVAGTGAVDILNVKVRSGYECFNPWSKGHPAGVSHESYGVAVDPAGWHCASEDHI